MDFLPVPRKLTYGEGTFKLNYQTVIVLEGTAPSALLYAQMLRDEIRRATGLRLSVLRGAPRVGDIALQADAALPADAYDLSIAPGGVRLRGGSDEALCHGVQTLRQCALQSGFSWPALDIADAPDLPNRGYYLDISRGRVPKLETLKQYADMLCRYKINQWQLYVEHTYLFRDFSEAWRDDTPLTAEEIMDLDAYCRARHIELVPSLATFGHMYKILSTKTHCDLCELEDSEKIPFTYTYAGEHHTLSVSDDRALGFIQSMVDEYSQLFTSKKFNICADETYDLGKGRGAKQAAEAGEQTLYIGHVAALCEYLVSRGYTPMFWGDIIWRHPETYKQLPKETVCLNWGYLPNQREDEIRILAEAGATQYACSGVCGWNRWIPLVKNSYDNVRVMCAHAHKFKAIGLLNTDWGDYAHINHPWFSIPGILYGAAFSWNGADLSFEEINSAISRLAYEDASGLFAGAFAALSEHEVFEWYHAVQWIEAREEGRRQEIFAHVDAIKTEAANRAIDGALHALHAISRGMPPDKRTHMQAIEVVSHGVQLWNEIAVYIARHLYGQPLKPARSGEALAEALETWYFAYLKVWREVSREGGLPKTMKLITDYADMLRGRETLAQ